jgi:hypothetical protein
MKLKWEIEEVEEMPGSQRNDPYTELYQMLDDMEPDGKPIRIGPMTLKEANSVQTSVTGHCNKSEITKVSTRKAQKNGTSVPKGSTEAVCYLFIQKITRVSGESSDESIDPEE